MTADSPAFPASEHDGVTPYMSRTDDLLWHVDHFDGVEETVRAPTIGKAISASSAEAPDDLESVSVCRVSHMLSEEFGPDWDADLETVLTSASPTPTKWSDRERLHLIPATAVDEHGRLNLEHLSNLRFLRRKWANLASVSFERGSVSVRALGACPADLLDYIRRWRAGGSVVLDPYTYDQTRAELAAIGTEPPSRPGG
ncbi:hypothetical protein ACTD5D_40325 [Nocardia takedensis]|uniref:hypothetical protein n=1 Tax=Nocardia takedensis TaxID=259390 RepID=UPI003F75D289